MKKLLQLLLVLCTGTSSLHAQTIITRWDFNASNATPSIGSGTIAVVGGATNPGYNSGTGSSDASATNLAYQTTTYPALGTNNLTAGIQINVSTAGYTQIGLSWDQRHSNTSNNTTRVQYTFDRTAGSPVWVDAEQYTFTPTNSSGDAWYNTRVGNFNTITGCDNNPNFAIRIVSEFDPGTGNYLASRSSSSYNTTGTWRFDMITVIGTAILPVTLSKFDARAAQKSVVLEWETQIEKNNSHFDLERSTDGRNFSALETIAGEGNSDVVKNYSYTDNNPLPGTNYYRLKQVDFDGKYTYSPVRSVVMDAASGLKLFPQPAAETLNMELEKAFTEEATWQVLDMSGRILAQGVLAAEQQQFELPVATLTQGAYVLRLVAGQTLLTQQFRKQ